MLDCCAALSVIGMIDRPLGFDASFMSKVSDDSMGRCPPRTEERFDAAGARLHVSRHAHER